jgi:hypothetical protein
MEEIRNKKCLTVLCKGIHTDCTVASNESRVRHKPCGGSLSYYLIGIVSPNIESCN